MYHKFIKEKTDYLEENSLDKERTLLVFIYSQESEDKRKERENELKALTESAGGEVIAMVSQNLNSLNPKTLIGQGKVEEIAECVKAEEIKTVIFDSELTGSQLKNLAKEIPAKIIDRVDLVLDIFALRARTKKAKLEVKLAQMELRLPRLREFGTYLSKAGGGIGTRGPGEQMLESDRRAVVREITSIKAQLEKLEGQKDVVAKKRRDARIPTVGLLGYTNVGKSTIMNGLLNLYGDISEDKEVYADDRLFATLEVSLRRIMPDVDLPYLLADTIGFMRNLPDKLKGAFSSTLAEISNADLLLLVVDSANDAYENQINTVLETVRELEITAPILYVMNRWDLSNPPFVTDANKTIATCAKKTESLKALSDRICEELYGKKKTVNLFFRYDSMKNYVFLDSMKRIISSEHTDSGINAVAELREKEIEYFGISDNIRRI